MKKLGAVEENFKDECRNGEKIISRETKEQLSKQRRKNKKRRFVP
jgi:hypothetical protein